MEFLVEDDLLQVKTSIKFILHKDVQTLLFYRPVKKPYNQTITYTWTLTVRESDGSGDSKVPTYKKVTKKCDIKDWVD